MFTKSGSGDDSEDTASGVGVCECSTTKGSLYHLSITIFQSWEGMESGSNLIQTIRMKGSGKSVNYRRA